MTTTTAYLLYLLLAAGGAAIYLLLPKPGRVHALPGVIIGLLALAGLLTVWMTRAAFSDETHGYFLASAGVALVSAVRVITHSRPVYSALYFVLLVLAVAVLLLLQEAEFLAVALIMIYAGAILVTYLFVIMLAQQAGSPLYDRRSRRPFGAVLAGFVLTAALTSRLVEPPTASMGLIVPTHAGGADEPPAAQAFVGNTMGIGATVMTKYVVGLELAGVLLLVSMIGAVALSRKTVSTDGFQAPPIPLGRIGREVKPY